MSLEGQLFVKHFSDGPISISAFSVFNQKKGDFILYRIFFFFFFVGVYRIILFTHFVFLVFLSVCVYIYTEKKEPRLC